MLRRGGCYQVTEPLHAVFLSYASQDAQAAQRICEALRAAGIEVWFDQSELRGGDVWDQSIRRQIKSCALFIPVISRNTHARDEGYFRLEWKLAVDRSHLMSANRAFLLPVVIDDTRDGEEHVPDRFREVQWTRVPAGATPAAFVERVQRLTSNEVSAPIRRSTGTPSGTAEDMRAPVWAFRSPTRGLFVALTAVVLATSAYSAYSANSSTLATAGFEKSEADARQAIVLASELAEAHMALALVLQLGAHDFAQANEEYQRSLALAPGNAAVLRTSGEFAAHMGHFAAGIAAARRAVVLDPLDRASYATLGVVLYAARRYGEAATTYAEAISLDPQFKASYGRRGLALYGLGDLESARASCERGGRRLEQSVVPRDRIRQARSALECGSGTCETEGSVRRCRYLSVRHGLRPMGRSFESARMARYCAARARPGTGAAENRSAHGSPASRATLPGDAAGSEVSDELTARLAWIGVA
jgi:tetratricopeptide (TPR) repeat protein